MGDAPFLVRGIRCDWRNYRQLRQLQFLLCNAGAAGCSCLHRKRGWCLAGNQGIRTNPAFAGTYAFHPGANYAALFPTFLNGMPEGGLIMCHPGKVDAELKRIDPVTDLREREFDFLSGTAFPRLLTERGVAI